MFTVLPLKGGTARAAEIMRLASASSTIPMWAYSVVSPLDGNLYSGQMVGRSPLFHGHRATTIPVYLVPVILTFASTGTAFDPTSPDPCLSSNNTVLRVVQNSPIFQNFTYIINGADVGNTQYVDAFQRANFWSDVSVAGNSYHTLLGLTTLPAVMVTVPAVSGNVNNASCGQFGSMDINWWDSYVQNTLLPSLSGQGVGPTSLPLFLFDSVVMYQGTATLCCILGYHSAYGLSTSVQTYSVSGFDTSGAFGGDVSILSHEVGEWMDDPLGLNPTPLWGNIGQVAGCQNNLEVGDPLTGRLFPPVVMNGFTYDPQELAFFSWFYRQVPSIGAGGVYSDNSSLTTHAGPVCAGS